MKLFSTERRRILAGVGLGLLILGAIFLFVLHRENTRLKEQLITRDIGMAQGWASRSVDFDVVENTAEGPLDLSAPEFECEGSTLKDGRKICVRVERDPKTMTLTSMQAPVSLQWSFVLFTPGQAERVIATREEAYQYDEASEVYVPVAGVAKASWWTPVGLSADEALMYYVRSQGLPIDGYRSHVWKDVWSLDLATGALSQVYATGDIWEDVKAPDIVDVDPLSRRLIVRYPDAAGMLEETRVLQFDGKVLATLPKLPFDLKSRESMMDNETFHLTDEGTKVEVSARREVPYGSGQDVEYGPVKFDIKTGKYSSN